MNIVPQIWGSALCLGCAALCVALFERSQWKDSVPLVFIAVIALTSNRFGMASGVLGSLGSALIFAYFLFEPLHALYVADDHQRQNLLLMAVSGMLLAEILKVLMREAKSSPSQRQDWHSGAPVEKQRA